MHLEFTAQQQEARNAFRAFARGELMPYADQYDRQERIPLTVIEKMARQGYLGALLSSQWGGVGMDMITFGILNEEIGSACSSTRSLLTVHSMVSYAILKWGNKQQKVAWLPRLAHGECIGAFALSEPGVGSDIKSIETKAVSHPSHYVLEGQKKWITGGQIADVFLLFAKVQGKLVAFLIERNTPGLIIKPISHMLGTRASMLAELHLQNCAISKDNIIGGSSLAPVAQSALDIGRYSVACGSVGIAQACLDATLDFTSKRKQYGTALKEHQLIRRMVTDMVTQVKAARLLCYSAGYLKDQGSPDAFFETFIAKYFASTAAMKIANDAVQIHGALGCSDESSVQRYLRDAKVMEIIEGSTQIQQISIAEYAYHHMM
jgi:glutaryl-CoA dehydrogenase (non-decarboxylating)